MKKKHYSPIALCAVAMLMMVFFLGGCGESQSEKKLHTFLDSFELVVDEYVQESENGGGEKVTQLSSQIGQLQQDWVKLRNEFGEELTPQQMERQVQRYDAIVARISGAKQS